MSSMCRTLQAKLAAGGPGSLREDPQGQHHLEECDECFAVLESLAQLDDALAELPQVDVSDSVIEQLLERPELKVYGTATEGTLARLRKRWFAWFSSLEKLDPFVLRSAASVAVLVLAIGLAYTVVSSLIPAFRHVGGDASQPTMAAVQVEEPISLEESALADDGLQEVEDSAVQLEAEMRKTLESLGYGAGGGSYGDADEDTEALRKSESVGGELQALGYIDGESVDELVISEPEPQIVLEDRMRPKPKAKERLRAVDQLETEANVILEESLAIDDLGGEYTGSVTKSDTVKSEIVKSDTKPASPPPAYREIPAEPQWVGTESDITFRGGSPRVEAQERGTFDGSTAEETRQRLKQRLNELPRGLEGQREAGAQEGAFANEKRTIEEFKKIQRGQRQEAAKDKEENFVDLAPAEAPALADGDQLAEIFLAERARVDGIQFQPAEGYWANTYVPGDPALRHLQASLLRRDRAALEAFSTTPLTLHDAVRQPTQPFDAPENAALAVYLHADRAAVEGRTRMLVQVGLQASERLGGRRPAMNLGVVLDLRGEISTSTSTTLRALMTAFAQARDLGDRFRLLVAGRAGGEVVGPEAFHHGPVTVTLERLLAGEELDGPMLSLTEALTQAAEAVSRDDDPTAPLGSSAVILVTDQPLGGDVVNLSGLAHRSALGGVTVSTLGVGDGVELNELENLALAGQGNRRLLHVPGEAAAAVERELTAVGRAVARAVRLRIRLAPGVELIDVLGSRRLDVAAAERVRQAEQSIDRRLSKNLGITADRGDDEDGLQIIIPSFYAGDSHVVLLDVVTAGAGPIADVRVRYKDLVYFENGVARGRLTLDRGTQPMGPLERNVLKNLLAADARGVFEDAGRLLQAGDAEAARERLETFRQLLLGLGRSLSNLGKDRDLERDIALLGEYVSLLQAGAALEDEVRSHLVDSLQFSGRLKVLPRPATSDGL